MLAGIEDGAAFNDSGRLSFRLSGTVGVGLGEVFGGGYDSDSHGSDGLPYNSGPARVEESVGLLTFSTKDGISGDLGNMLDAEAQLKLSAMATLGTETAAYTVTAFDLGC